MPDELATAALAQSKRTYDNPRFMYEALRTQPATNLILGRARDQSSDEVCMPALRRCVALAFAISIHCVRVAALLHALGLCHGSVMSTNILAGTIQLTYLFDPLCGWCYGASPVLRTLASHTGHSVVLAPSGLFCGERAGPMNEEFASYAWTHDQRIARLTSQRFTERYRRDVLGDRAGWLDSGPATLALTAVALTASGRELDALEAIQEARYVAGRDVTDSAVLAEVLASLDLTHAAELIRAPNEALLSANRARVESSRNLMRQFGVSGVPAVIVDDGVARQLLDSPALFVRVEDLVARLQRSTGESSAVAT